MSFEEAKTILLRAISTFKSELEKSTSSSPGPEQNFVAKYDVSDANLGLRGSVVLHGLVTPNPMLAAARAQELSRYLEGVAQPPTDTILSMLLAQSFLRVMQFDLSMVEPVKVYLERTILLVKDKVKTDHPEFRRVFVPTRDTLEKLGILLRASRDISRAPVGFSAISIKKDFYLFVWATKAVLDSLAVLLKTIYNLPESGGKVDLGKGQVGGTGFVASLAKANSNLAVPIGKEFRAWIQDVQRYRTKQSIVAEYSFSQMRISHIGCPMIPTLTHYLPLGWSPAMWISITSP